MFFDNYASNVKGAGFASSLVLTYVFNVTSEHQYASIKKWSKQAAWLNSAFYVPESLIHMRNVKELRHRAFHDRSKFEWVSNFMHGFWTLKDLVENAEKIDVFVVLLGYFFMHFTFKGVSDICKRKGGQLIS